MFQKLPRIFTCVGIFFLSTFSSQALVANLSPLWEQNKIINNLQLAVENSPIFHGCTFTLFDPDLPEHKDYYESIRKRNALTSSLSQRLNNDLSPKRLRYFHQFKERIYVTRRHGFCKKDTADYCILYAKEFNAKTKAWDKSSNQWHDESLSKCNEKYENFCLKINRLENTINEDFLRYYTLGYPGYDTYKSIYDHGLVQLAVGNVEEAVKLADDFLEEVYKEKKDLRLISSEQFLSLGITYIEAMEYSKAIDFLNASIEKNPSNKEAYFQRAVAYLETGMFNQAIDDFLVSEKSLSTVGSQVKAPNDFTGGFLDGLVKGSNEALLNFFPSLYSFAYASIVHPIDSFANYANACYELMHITAEYLKQVDWSRSDESNSNIASILLEPGLKRLYEKMDGLDAAEKGYLLGHSIGSYGTDFIAGVGLIKGVNTCVKLANACQSVREASRIYELESLAQSSNAVEPIIAKAAERIVIRETILQGAKSGKIVIKRPNVQLHIMQEKHAWDKLIQVSQNIDVDFTKVVKLLEEHDISNNLFLQGVPQYFPKANPRVCKSEYEKIINGWKVHAEFETYLETGEVFLKDAWVVTR